jgi:hypothetical protein
MEFYWLRTCLDGEELFLLWGGNDQEMDDAILGYNGGVLVFGSDREAQEFLLASGMPCAKEGRRFDLDALVNRLEHPGVRGLDVGVLLDAWNLMLDMGEDVLEGSSFAKMSEESEALHRRLSEESISRGLCSTQRTDAEFLATKDLEALSRIVRAGIRLLKASLRRLPS